MANIINHNTITSDIYMYMDSVVKNDTHYIFTGWIGAVEDDIVELSYGTDLENIHIPTVEFYKRPDILEYYSFKSGVDGNYGVNFSIPIELIEEKKACLYAKLTNGNWYILGSLRRWVAYHSGFNREHKDLIVVDDFYAYPDFVRDFAINNIGYSPSKYHKGERAEDRFILNGTKQKLEKIIGREIYNWNYEGYANGIFQFCTADQPIVYHVDTQMYAGIVYLTPDAPPETGTAFYKSKVNGRRKFEGNDRSSSDYIDTFKGLSNEPNFYDGTQFELVDVVGNVYNRLVLFNAAQIHAAVEYFGDDINNSRFFHMFFFDVK